MEQEKKICERIIKALEEIISSQEQEINNHQQEMIKQKKEQEQKLQEEILQQQQQAARKLQLLEFTINKLKDEKEEQKKTIELAKKFKQSLIDNQKQEILQAISEVNSQLYQSQLMQEQSISVLYDLRIKDTVTYQSLKKITML